MTKALGVLAGALGVLWFGSRRSSHPRHPVPTSWEELHAQKRATDEQFYGKQTPAQREVRELFDRLPEKYRR